ncbi:MAG: D-glycero-beta-D-manno-heptose 1,7-bisphosphate 7-phosphatase [Helicobacteraceae bacterium]|nr:D-glycero-beta-D-manno-heptose 1,7-bisphosphate 7-phosphatase [Helicobacteraceae bacterium]
MSRPALFLDRDGVVNVEKNYLHKVEDFEFIDGIFDLCHKYQALGYMLIIITNQSGIARGYYSEEEFEKLTEWMIETFGRQGIIITDVYHCPHHPDISGACSCRKPEPGMILDAAQKHAIDLECSLLVGDSERDITAAHRAGIKESYLFSANANISAATKIIRSLKELV